jgi:hypothetical protein
VALGLGLCGLFAEGDEIDLLAAELQRTGSADEVFVRIISVVLIIVLIVTIPRGFAPGKNVTGVGGENGCPEMFAELSVIFEMGAGAVVGVFGAVPSDVHFVFIRPLDVGADAGGVVVEDVDSALAEVNLALVACGFTEISLKRLECPQ